MAAQFPKSSSPEDAAAPLLGALAALGLAGFFEQGEDGGAKR
jgi:hypothetical protein